MTHARTIWEEGREPGSRVVALAAALALTAIALDLVVGSRVGVFFDIVFVVLSLGAALLVRPPDMFVVGVLPPLLMVGAFLLVALTRTPAIASPGDGVIQAVVTGLGRHSIALLVGYGLCLGALAMRRHVAQLRGA